MVWLQVLATAVVCGAIIADAVKNKHRNEQCQTDCNSCAFLERKNKWSFNEYEYYCKKYNGFDKPPIFCADYVKRSEEN